MRTAYYIMAFTSNLKTDDDKVRYSVEASDGGGIEYIGQSLHEAKNWINNNNGYVDFIT